VRSLLFLCLNRFSLSLPSNAALSPIYEVVSFAENKTTCRKILFSSYFSSAYNRAEAFDAEDGDAPCGHCDNVCLPLSHTFLLSADTVRDPVVPPRPLNRLLPRHLSPRLPRPPHHRSRRRASRYSHTPSSGRTRAWERWRKLRDAGRQGEGEGED
jgi:hypothetical protein